LRFWPAAPGTKFASDASAEGWGDVAPGDEPFGVPAPVCGDVPSEEDLRFARNSGFALSFTTRVCGAFAFGFGPGFLRCLDGVGREGGAAMFEPAGDGGTESGDDFAAAPMTFLKYLSASLSVVENADTGVRRDTNLLSLSGWSSAACERKQ